MLLIPFVMQLTNSSFFSKKIDWIKFSHSGNLETYCTILHNLYLVTSQ